MQVKEITTDELKTLIRETVIVLGELLLDPNEGKTLKKEFKRELLEIQRFRQTGVRGISTQEAMNRLGLGG